MASTTLHKIVVQAANQSGDVTRQEALAGEAGITPGELLEHTTGGAVLRHNAAAGDVSPKLIALESPHVDDDDNFAIDVDYASGDTVYMAVAKPGDRFYMWLASGENVAVNAMLQSDGDGMLAEIATIDATTVVDSLVGRACEAVNATAAAARIVVEIT